MADSISDAAGARERFRRPAPSLTGQLLIATPALQDPNFERAVVYILANDRVGGYGVILNRATDIPVQEVLGGFAELAAEPRVAFEGGPVDPDSAVCLVRARIGANIPDFDPIDGRVGTVEAPVDLEDYGDQLEEIRVFCGYAGWAPGQLREEIADGAWLVVHSLPGDLFAPMPDDLWQTVLRRQGGMLSALALYPSSPILN